jgi:hypothetical protein
MSSRYIFDKVNQDITASITKQVDRDIAPSSAPTIDDLACALIFIVSVTLLILL